MYHFDPYNVLLAIGTNIPVTGFVVQIIKNISKGSCDTENRSNSCWKFSFAITETNYNFKYIKIEYNILFCT